MALYETLFGRPQQIQQLSRLSAPQQALSNQIGSLVSSGLQPGGAYNFAPIAQKARTQFQTQTIPGLAERFTSLGGSNRGSSAFQGALGSAASGLEEGLAGLQSQHGLSQLQALLGHSLQPQFENLIYPETSGLFGSIGSSLGQGIGLLPLLLSLL